MKKSSEMMPSKNHIQEWAIINQQRAIEARKMSQLKKQAQYNKKQQFKNDLDHQILSKSGQHGLEQKSDKQYLQYILKKAQQQKQREQQYKRQKIMKRKQIQQQNFQTLNLLRNQRPKQTIPQYKLQIGIQSELDQKQRERRGIKQMMDTLDLQIRQKHREGQKSRLSEFGEQVNTSFVNVEGPNPAKSPKYKQDQKIYENYEKLLNQRKKQEEQFYKIITEQANRKIDLESQNRVKAQRQKKQALTAEMMQTLDHQVKNQASKRAQQKYNNPEQSSFQYISQMWREKPVLLYDKRQYSEELRRQADEQKEKRKLQKYMSQQQYKLNMNQLNKIAYGQYTYDKYVDRSLDNIGATQIRQPVKSYEKNSQFLKGQLQKLKNRQRAGFYSRMQQSYW